MPNVFARPSEIARNNDWRRSAAARKQNLAGAGQSDFTLGTKLGSGVDAIGVNGCVIATADVSDPTAPRLIAARTVPGSPTDVSATSSVRRAASIFPSTAGYRTGRPGYGFTASSITP